MRSEEFIDLYKQLEDALEEKFSGKKRRFSSVIYEYINSYESAQVRDELNLCREIRNLLTHNANFGGMPIVEPSEPVMEALKGVIEYVRRPPLALEFATVGSRILCAKPTDKILKLMETMDRNGFSHIPVLDGEKFLGVFSVSTIFSAVLRSPAFSIGADTTIASLAQHLPVDRHVENFAFVARDTSSVQAKRMFEKIRGKNKRLSVIFITETGTRDEPLLGMLSPWDLMKEE